MSPRAQRIVSFLASGTEILVALGLEDNIVGISHECDYPADILDRPRLSRPRFNPADLDSGQVDQAVRDAMRDYGSVYEIDRDQLRALAPDLILTQAVCEVCAVPTPGVSAVTRELGLDARVLSLDAHTIGDILATITQVGVATGVPQRAEVIVALLRRRLDGVQRALQGVARPGVLALEWLDPPFAPGHWVPEMIELAGGECLLGRTGAHSDQIAWDDVADLDPDVLVIMPCGYDVERSRADADANTAQLASIAQRAIANERAYIVNGSSYFNRSGPRVVDGVEILAGLLHSDRVREPSEDAGTRWQPNFTHSEG